MEDPTIDNNLRWKKSFDDGRNLQRKIFFVGGQPSIKHGQELIPIFILNAIKQKEKNLIMLLSWGLTLKTQCLSKASLFSPVNNLYTTIT